MNPTPEYPGWIISRHGDAHVRDLLRGMDWTREALALDNLDHLELAARGVAVGGIAVHAAANIYVFGARPDEALVRYVNEVKGRPANQTGTIVTTPERIPALFDWRRLPRGVTREQVEALIDVLLNLGPFGFRGPARPGLPHFMTADDDGVRTVQVVSPGNLAPTNHLYARILDQIPEPYLYGTSGNRSRRVTGADEEPVHTRLAPLQADFGRVPGFFMVHATDEGVMRRTYPLHAPMSVTVLSFHKLGPAGPLPALVVERHGSLELEYVRRAARAVELDLYLAPAARRRLSERQYLDESARAA